MLNRSIGWFLGSSRFRALFTRASRAFVSIWQINQIALFPFVCCLSVCSRVFISRSYENRSIHQILVTWLNITQRFRRQKCSILHLLERRMTIIMTRMINSRPPPPATPAITVLVLNDNPSTIYQVITVEMISRSTSNNNRQVNNLFQLCVFI